MSRFNFACETYGPAVLELLIEDSSSIEAFAKLASSAEDNSEKAKFFGAAWEQYYESREDAEFLSRLRLKQITPEDMASYVRPVFTAFAHMTDPSSEKKNSNWKYLNWICRAYTADESDSRVTILAEDLYKIKDALKDFDAFKNLLEVKQRDIDFYEGYGALQQTLWPHQRQRDEKLARKKERKIDPQKREEIMQATTFIYDGPEGRIVVPHTAQASIYWGQQTKWCTAAEASSNYFSRYNSKEPLWLYIAKPSQKERKIDHHFQSFKFTGTEGRLYDEHDRNPDHIPPYLERLIKAALSSVPAARKRYLRRHGGYRKYKPVVPSNPEKWSDKSVMRRAIKKSVRAAKYLAPELRNDKDFMLTLLKSKNSAELLSEVGPRLWHDKSFVTQVLGMIGSGHVDSVMSFASTEIRSDREIMVDAVRVNGRAYRYLAAELRHDRELALLAVSSKGDSFELLPKELQADKQMFMSATMARYSCHKLPECFVNDREVVLAWAKRNNSYVSRIPAKYHADKDFLLSLLKARSLDGFEELSETAPQLLEDKDFAKDVFALKGRLVRHFSDAIKSDRNMVLAAIKNDPSAIEVVPKEFRADREIVLMAVEKNPETLCFADSALKADKEIVIAAVRKNGAVLEYATHALRGDKDVVMAALGNTSEALQYASLEFRFNRSARMQGALMRTWNATFGAAFESGKSFMRTMLPQSDNGQGPSL